MVKLTLFVPRTNSYSCSSNIEPTYGRTIIPDLKKSFESEPEGTFESTVQMWDTRVKGRPNVMDLIEETVRAHNLEMVFVTSNRKGTTDTIRGCAERGIACHGPIWDS